MKNHRPNPNELLEVVQKLDAGSKRGHLRIFLGMCAGVGKTYAMLKAAKEQQTRSVNVAIGVVETHGRKETQDLLKDMSILAKKTTSYRGTDLFEMDLDAILRQRPALVLVDELAHTNIPGSRHAKRYQDVEEILDAGLDVYTTVNIQHIESRNDQVAQITEIHVKETVPDSFFEKADQIEVVDLSPIELLQRLKEGKVYLGERAERAAEHFFKVERLTALRELALRFTAEKVDQDLLDQMTIKGIEGPWNINERLLVAISHSPYSGRLIRAARRMAYTLEAPWIALHVDTGETLSEEDQKILNKNLNLARDLGAEMITMADTSLTAAIASICRDKNVTQIVMGRPDRRFFRDFFTGGTLLDQLVKTTSKIDIHVLRARRISHYKGFYVKWPQFRTGLVSYYNTAWFLAVVFFASYLISPYLGYRALGSVFLLSILAVAGVSSRGPIFFAAVTCAFVWNYFFIPPRFTFAITSSEDFMMVFSFLVVAVVSGLLTARIRKQERILQRREQRARALYEFGKNLSNDKTEPEIAGTLTTSVDNEMNSKAIVFIADLENNLRPVGQDPLNDKDFAVATWVFEHGKNAGWSTQTLSASPCLCVPMKGNSGTVGVLCIYPDADQKILLMEQENFIETVLGQASIAIERLRFQEAAQTAKIYEASEKLHQTLINSVSHELRTPITAMIGTATALQDLKTFESSEARTALTTDLVDAAKRLDRVVENLLDMSRLEKGTLQLKKEWFEIQDLLTDVQQDLAFELERTPIHITGNVQTLIEGDFKLLQHALLNIILNAVKYAPQSPIEIDVKSLHQKIAISIKDHGVGIPLGSEKQLFQKFYRAPGTPAGGIGLGLSITKNIIELHGGKISAGNRADDHGAEFIFELPAPAAPLNLQGIVNERS